MKPPYIPHPHDHVLETKGMCHHCGGPVDEMVDGSFCCRCCGSQGTSLDAMGSPVPPRRVEVPDGDQLAKFIKMLHDGEGMLVMNDGKAVELENFAHLVALNKREDTINICALMTEPGTAEAMATLETKVFPSANEFLNPAWEVRIIRWESLIWQMVSIKDEYLDAVAHHLLLCGFRIVDGIPTMIDGPSTRQFPVHTPTTYTIKKLPPEEMPEIEVLGENMGMLPPCPNPPRRTTQP